MWDKMTKQKDSNDNAANDNPKPAKENKKQQADQTLAVIKNKIINLFESKKDNTIKNLLDDNATFFDTNSKLIIGSTEKDLAPVYKKANKKIQNMILANKDKTLKGSIVDEEERKALMQFKVDESSYNKLDMFLFSKQVDSLYNEISEFDKCFPESSFAI